MATCGATYSPRDDSRHRERDMMAQAEDVQVSRGKACSRCGGACPGFELHYWSVRRIGSLKATWWIVSAVNVSKSPIKVYEVSGKAGLFKNGFYLPRCLRFQAG
ncbi:hypothetical protein DPMN_005356 [Dreissena polymorpha]|uniref:Uncharacterized protein n=1 Tax=Dreissena polymorpha TaxID=45954 RepID=A0A9D4RWE8_DREPO|nr:hypothetical protein DPMN_005356 [Dreissena polymorpha]